MHYFTPALNKLVRQKIVQFYPLPYKHTFLKGSTYFDRFLSLSEAKHSRGVSILIVTVTDGQMEPDRQRDRHTLSHSEVPQAKINLSSSLQ